MAGRSASKKTQMVVRDDYPLIGIPDRENGHDIVRYFTAEETESISSQAGIQRALDLACAWSDLDWDEMREALDRIHHESSPTPPLTL